MSQFELTLSDISVQEGSIAFPQYEQTLQSAEKLNERLKTVQVTEESIQSNKKLVAQVRKEANRLEDVRKEVKKQINQPYVAFEQKVKTIVNTVKEGEDIIRQQVRTFEEEQRQEKHNLLLIILNDRLQMKRYRLIQTLNVDSELIITSQMLNKSVSLDKAEQQMVDTLETIVTNCEVLSEMEHANELLEEYSRHLDMTTAIKTVSDRHKRLETIEQAAPQKRTEPKSHVITLFNSDDYIKVVQFMNDQGITYK